MGYTTEFEGAFEFSTPVAPEHMTYLQTFSEVRHMKRDSAKAEQLPDPVRVAAGLTIGQYGEYFVGGGGYAGQDEDRSVLDGNWEPPSQPGLWCGWTVNEFYGDYLLEWNGREKFYSYVDWLEYIIRHFLVPWGYTINGEVRWRGEEFDDVGRITVKDNVVEAERMSW